MKMRLFLLLLILLLLLLVAVVVVVAETTTAAAELSSASARHSTVTNEAVDANGAAYFANNADADTSAVKFPTTTTTTKTTVATTAVTARAQRFPSVEERVRLYMSNWYVPPCANYSHGFIEYSYHEQRNKPLNYAVLHLLSHFRRPSVIHHPRYLNESNNDKNNNAISPEYYQIEPVIQPDQVFYVDRTLLLECAQKESNISKENGNNNAEQSQHPPQELQDASSAKKHHPRRADSATSKRRMMIAMKNNKKLELLNKNMRMYCQDTLQSLQVAWDHVVFSMNGADGFLLLDDVPLLLQYGDMKTTHIYGRLELPHIKKFRSAAAVTVNSVSQGSSSSSSLECLQHPPTPLSTVHGSHIMQPILWKLATHRHYRLLPKVYRHDTPWDQKRNQAIFRGQLTGALDFYNKSLSDYDNCMQSRRCRLVYQHATSPWINAKLTSTRQRIPAVLNNVNMTSSAVTIRHLLQYKAIIMLEGNDVASGLKWALLSQSVVLMPPPQHTSWAMEELLQPWVHYIPLLPDASDVEEKMKWIVHHDAKARWIAERGTLWIEDLVFHPDAKQDDRRIEEEIVRRYRAHFRPAA